MLNIKIIAALVAALTVTSGGIGYAVLQPPAQPDNSTYVPAIQGDIVVVPDVVAVQLIEVTTPESEVNAAPQNTIKYTFSHNGTYTAYISEDLKPLMQSYPLAPVDYDPNVPIFSITLNRIEICATQTLNSTQLAQDLAAILTR